MNLIILMEVTTITKAKQVFNFIIIFIIKLLTILLFHSIHGKFLRNIWLNSKYIEALLSGLYQVAGSSFTKNLVKYHQKSNQYLELPQYFSSSLNNHSYSFSHITVVKITSMILVKPTSCNIYGPSFMFVCISGQSHLVPHGNEKVCGN